MKKNFLKAFVAVAVVALMTACAGGLDGKIGSYEKACKAGDFEKAQKIAEEIEANYEEKDLTEDQQARLEKATLELFNHMEIDN